MPVKTIENMKVILTELKEHCNKTASLIDNMDTKFPTEDEKDDYLGELIASIIVLHTKSKLIDEYFDEMDITDEN